eukprot:5657698-Prymnesium_polylepis.1
MMIWGEGRDGVLGEQVPVLGCDARFLTAGVIYYCNLATKQPGNLATWQPGKTFWQPAGYLCWQPGSPGLRSSPADSSHSIP